VTSRASTPGRVRRWRTPISIGLIVLAAAVLVFVFNGRFGQDPRLVDSPLVGQQAPDLTLPYLEENGALTLSDLEGQIVVLNFWASWCGPCRAEHDALTTASAVYADRGVHFVGILYQDQEAQAMSFLDELGRGVNYSYVTDHDSSATVELGVFGVPETYFIDANGVVRGRVQGDVSPTLLVGTIEDLLAGRELDF
jgi:cytochrome c biogenesis protein CcmG, thiol:disulfide interchange protein DsbE